MQSPTQLISPSLLLDDMLLQATGPLVRMVIQIAVDMKYFLMLMFAIGMGKTLSQTRTKHIPQHSVVLRDAELTSCFPVLPHQS